MPRRDEGAAPTEVGPDRLGALPDDALRHVLSFLPAQEAVQTCVLARRWRHLWKSAPGLRVCCFDFKVRPSVKEIQGFVDRLLLSRAGSPLDTCDIILFEFDDDDMPHINNWIRHVLLCKVQVLGLMIGRKQDAFRESWLELDQLPLVSHHLRSLKLFSLQMNDSILDFSSCSVLEDLRIECCDFSNADRILSPSLKSLSIHCSCTFSQYSRTHVYAPNIVSLHLDVDSNRTPVLERMPSLVEAVVELGSSVYDSCGDAESGDCNDESCIPCYGIYGDTKSSVLLQGLSEAKNLALISDIRKFIFRRDLKWCPTFSNLKTLLLNENWCVPADLSALACILEHSPILEKLTLQLFCQLGPILLQTPPCVGASSTGSVLFQLGPKSKVEMKGHPDPTQRSTAMCKHLKIVEVQCEVVDERILSVLKFLNKLNIHLYTTSFNFEE